MDKINKISIVNNESNNPKYAYVHTDDGLKKVPYDFKVHDQMIIDFANEFGLDTSSPDFLNQLIAMGHLEIVPENSKEAENLETEFTRDSLIVKFPSDIDPIADISPDTEPTFDDEEEKDDEDINSIRKDKNKRKTIKTIAVTTAAVAGVTGALAVTLSQCSKRNGKSTNKNIDFNTASFDELMKALPEDSELRKFSQTAYDVTEQLNKLAKDESVFALEADKKDNAVLQFTYDEVSSAMLVLNNYSGEELFSIFGLQELDAQAIEENYYNFVSKMSLYAMNGKAPSTVSTLITDKENRTWFEDLEGKLVEFNKNQTTDAADRLIRTFGYSYIHGINGANDSKMDKSTEKYVKHLMLNMVRGYYDANVEEKYSHYLKVTSEPGTLDEEYRDNKASQIQSGEKLKDMLDTAEKGSCTIAAMREHISSDIITPLANQQMVTKVALASTALDKKDVKSSEKILSGQMTYEEYVELENKENNVPVYNQVKNAADRELVHYIEVKDDILYNNRIRGVEKIETYTGTSVSKDEWDKMSAEQKLDFAKKNGKVISNTTTTTSKKVNKSDLTPSERKEAEKQEKDFNEVQIDKNTYKGDKATAAKAGWTDATNYAEEKGAYSHADIYNRINPNAVSKVPTQGTLSDIAQAAYAFNNERITSSDSQIQARLSKDLSKRGYTGEMAEAYKSGWLNGINQKLNSAVSQGAITRKEAEDLYKEAQKQAERKNNNKNNNSNNNNSNNNNNNNSNNNDNNNDSKDDTPIESEKPSDNVIDDPNLAGPEDSDFGDDIYDENYDGYETRSGVNSQSKSYATPHVNTSYYEELAKEALKELFEAQEQEYEGPVLRK